MTGGTIVQWNCRGFKANFYELKILYERLNPLALCLQETFLRQTDIHHFKYYKMYNCFGPEGDRAAGGTSIQGPVLLTSHSSPKRLQAPLYSQTSHFNRMTRITKNFCRQNHASGRTTRSVRNHSPKLSHTHHRQHI